MSLLEKYEAMKLAEAEEVEKTAEEAELEKIAEEDLEILTKYATVADNLLAEEFGEDYNEDDVVKLATKLIENDVAEAEDYEKIAALEEAGQIIAKSFLAELNKEA